MRNQTPSHLSPNDLKDWLNNESSKPEIIDVRENQELAIAPFSVPVVHLPLSESSSWIENLRDLISQDRPVVVICHSGIRSWDFACWLNDQDWGYEVWNLDGGIDAWSIDVDSDVPRY